MAQQNRQIAALKKLASLYWSIMPDTFREFPIAGAEFFEAEQQLAREDRKFSREIDAARRELLATGLPVPDSWLTVQAVGALSSQTWRVGKSSKFQGRIDIKNPERDRLRRVILPEMYAARMRLEAGGGADLHAPYFNSRWFTKNTAGMITGDQLRQAGHRGQIAVQKILGRQNLYSHPDAIAKWGDDAKQKA